MPSKVAYFSLIWACFNTANGPKTSPNQKWCSIKMSQLGTFIYVVTFAFSTRLESIIDTIGHHCWKQMPQKFNTVLHFHEKVEFLRLWIMHKYIDCQVSKNRIIFLFLCRQILYSFFPNEFKNVGIWNKSWFSLFCFLFQCMQILKCNSKARAAYETNVPDRFKELILELCITSIAR